MSPTIIRTGCKLNSLMGSSLQAKGNEAPSVVWNLEEEEKRLLELKITLKQIISSYHLENLKKSEVVVAIHNIIYAFSET